MHARHHEGLADEEAEGFPARPGPVPRPVLTQRSGQGPGTAPGGPLAGSSYRAQTGRLPGRDSGHSLTADENQRQKTGTSAGKHVNVQRPGETPGRARRCLTGRARNTRNSTCETARADMVPNLEFRLPDSAVRSVRFTFPVLFEHAGWNAWSGRMPGDYGAVSTRLCVCGLCGRPLRRGPAAAKLPVRPPRR